MRKLVLLTILSTLSYVGFSQTQHKDDKELILSTEKIVVKENEKEKIVTSSQNESTSEKQIDEESTIDPKVTGHTKVVINGKEVYRKVNESMIIINDPNK